MNQSKDIDSQQSLVEVMLEFVRAAVLERDPIIPRGAEIDWGKLMDMSAEHGLLALVWDGICKLPQELQPPRQQRINWGLSAQETYKTFDSQVKVLKKIINTCEMSGMRLLLLKGLGLSSLYPRPQARLCSDIDIFLFDDYEKGNQIWNSYLVKEIGKHSTIYLDGIMIENHNNFLEPNTIQKRKIIRYIKSSLSDVIRTDGGYYVLPIMTNLVFLTFHTLKHFQEGLTIPIRNIVDFALFLNNNSDSINSTECSRILKDLNLIKGFELLRYFSKLILQFDFEDYHFYTIPESDRAIFEQTLLIEKHDRVNARLLRIPFGTKKDRKTIVLLKYIPRNYSFKQIYVPVFMDCIRKVLHVPENATI